jgi:hypothetical protein
MRGANKEVFESPLLSVAASSSILSMRAFTSSSTVTVALITPLPPIVIAGKRQTEPAHEPSGQDEGEENKIPFLKSLILPDAAQLSIVDEETQSLMQGIGDWAEMKKENPIEKRPVKNSFIQGA